MQSPFSEIHSHLTKGSTFPFSEVFQGLHSLVLSKASEKMLGVKAKNWSESAHRLLKLCADSGSVEACYTFGMSFQQHFLRRPEGHDAFYAYQAGNIHEVLGRRLFIKGW